MKGDFKFHSNSDKIVSSEVDSQGNRFYCDFLGNKYISVTTLLRHFEDQTSLTDWKEKIGHEEAGAIVKEALEIGNLSHAQIEQYLATGEVQESFTSHALNAIKFFYSKTLPIKFEEAFLYQDKDVPDIRYAGRFDQLLYLKEPFYYLDDTSQQVSSKYVIADLKTKKRPVRLDKADFIYKHCLQQAAYAHAVNSLQSEPVITGGIIVITTKQTVKLLYLDAPLLEYYWNIFYRMLLDYYFIEPLGVSWKELVDEASMYYDGDTLELSSKMPHLISC